MIIPALLTDNRKKLVAMINTCAEFSDYVHVDVMDGKFVSSKSITLLDLEGWKSSIRCGAHLMVSDPFEWIEPFKKIGAKRIIYHFEIKKNHFKIISKIREMNLMAGIAVNPSTAIEEFQFLVEKVDTVLFMAVNPGFYGAEFIPGVLKKIKIFKDKYPHKLAGIDGGIKLSNLLKVKDAGVDYVCVGSAILKSRNPGREYCKFLNLFNG